MGSIGGDRMSEWAAARCGAAAADTVWPNRPPASKFVRFSKANVAKCRSGGRHSGSRTRQKQPDDDLTRRRQRRILIARWAPARACQADGEILIRTHRRYTAAAVRSCVRGVASRAKRCWFTSPPAPPPAERVAHRRRRWKPLWSGLFWDFLIWLKVFFANVGYSLIKVVFLVIVWVKKNKTKFSQFSINIILWDCLKARSFKHKWWCSSGNLNVVSSDSVCACEVHSKHCFRAAVSFWRCFWESSWCW